MPGPVERERESVYLHSVSDWLPLLIGHGLFSGELGIAAGVKEVEWDMTPIGSHDVVRWDMQLDFVLKEGE